MWNIWLLRNQVIFNDRTSFTDPFTNTISYAFEFFCLLGGGPKPKNLISTLVKWSPPTLGWAKLYTDGSSLGNPSAARVGV